MIKALILGIISLVATTGSHKDYKIEGKCVDPQAKGRITLIAYDDNNRLDTIAKCPIVDGKFTLSGAISKSKTGYLLINDRLKDYVPIILDEANYQMVVDGDVVISITGTQEQDVLSQYIATQIEQNKLLEEFRNRPLDDRRNDSIKRMYREREAPIAIKTKEAQFKLVEKYPNFQATPLFFNLTLKEKGLEELTFIYSKLTGAGKDNTYADKILQRIELLQALEIGAVAPNFSLNTPAGETLTMHEIPGKVKIIDFWASWCYPCRKENPFMVKLYEKYHEKGLEIIGVSLDNDHKKWTTAIEKDGLPWIHISALKKWKCESVKLYDVKSVPHTVILDGENRIIARNVRGEELEKLIAKILDAQ